MTVTSERVEGPSRRMEGEVGSDWWKKRDHQFRVPAEVVSANEAGPKGNFSFQPPSAQNVFMRCAGNPLCADLIWPWLDGGSLRVEGRRCRPNPGSLP